MLLGRRGEESVGSCREVRGRREKTGEGIEGERKIQWGEMEDGTTCKFAIQIVYLHLWVQLIDPHWAGDGESYQRLAVCTIMRKMREQETRRKSDVISIKGEREWQDVCIYLRISVGYSRHICIG
jgi:hypothetical protein